MCSKKTYKRLKKLHDYITDKKCKYTAEFDGVCYKYKTFFTKLGARDVISSLLDKTVILAYHDEDKSLLFSIAVDTRGKITILQSKIDEIAIFSAIYELECIIYEYKHQQRAKMLEDLFSYYNPSFASGLGFSYPYRG